MPSLAAFGGGIGWRGGEGRGGEGRGGEGRGGEGRGGEGRGGERRGEERGIKLLQQLHIEYRSY